MSAITAGHLSINGVSVGAVAAGTTVAGQAANVRTAINSVSAQTGVYAVAASSSSDATVTLRSLSAITVNAFGATALSTNTGLTAATTATSTQTGFASGGIFTAAAASEAMTAIDAALSTIGTARATMGSIQSRFEAVISNAQITSENLTASRSRIQDADFAEETARLTRAQILQQAGTAMLAQANAVPQSVLALLRG
jgi:flagellin